MKYQTEKPDYTNCHPGVAECLQRGEYPLCEVWDGEEKPESPLRSHVRWYRHKRYPYMTDIGPYDNAEPIPKKIRRVKKTSEIIRMLEDEGYVYCPGSSTYVGPQLNEIVTKYIHEIAGHEVFEKGIVKNTSRVCLNEDWIEEVQE